MLAHHDSPAGCTGSAPGRTDGILGVVPSATAPHVLYASSYRGTLYVSTDGGQHWGIRSRETPGWVIADVASAQHDLLIETRLPSGLFASSDGGRSWRAWSCSWIVSSVSASAGGQVVWVGTAVPLSGQGNGGSGGLYETSNAGRSWSHTFQLPDVNVNAILAEPRDSKVVLVGTEAGGVSLSTDRGAHFEWRTIGTPSLGFPHGDQVTVFAASPADPGVVWAGTRNDGVFRGLQDGRRWVRSGLPSLYVEDMVANQALRYQLNAAAGPLAFCSAHLSRSPSRAGTYSTVTGTSWKLIRALPAEMNLAASGRASTVYAWCNHAIYSSSEDGQRWQRLAQIP